MQPSSAAAVLCTLLVAIFSVAHIPCSHASTAAVVALSAGSGEMLMAKVAKMEMRGEVIREKTVSSSPGNSTSINLQAVCNLDTSRPSSLMNVCKIVMEFPAGQYVCSGWVVSRNKVATAGHCVVDGSGYSTSVYVVCNGIRRAATHFITTSAYYNRVFVKQGGDVHWSDAAVIRLSGSLPSTIVPWEFVDASCKSKEQRKLVTVSGYPATTTGRCKYDGVVQWWSPGSLWCVQDGDGFYRTDFDTCGGGSGSVAYDASTNKAMGIFVADNTYTATGQCIYNMVARILDNASGGVNSGRGVSIRALMNGVPK